MGSTSADASGLFKQKIPPYSWGPGQTSTSGPRPCNCIGCCSECGQCLTQPTHPGTCQKVAKLKREIAAVITAERNRLGKLHEDLDKLAAV